MFQRLSVITGTLGLILATAGASAADVQAGKAKVDKVCSECHQSADWKGTSEAELATMIKDVVSGKVKHAKKLQLTDAEIADIAAYWASAAK